MENYENNNIPEEKSEEVEVVETESKAKDWKKELKEWIITIAAAAIIAFLLQTFVLQIACVSGPSMLPTLQDKDVLYVNKLLYTPEKGDVVIVNMEKRLDPSDPFYEQKKVEQYHVKRVIATEGDTLFIDKTTGNVYVNGELIEEPYINNETINLGSYLEELAYNGKFSMENPLVIGEGEVFVMGDNRQRSLDCRENGPYTVDMIEGHAAFRLWPLNTFGGFDED